MNIAMPMSQITLQSYYPRLSWDLAALLWQATKYTYTHETADENKFSMICH